MPRLWRCSGAGLCYSDILARVHVAIAALIGATTTPDLDTDFGASISHLPAFSDTAAALGYLQTRFKLVILSNVHREGFAASQRHLGIEFDAIYTAEDIGSYKPAAANFEYMIEHVHSDFGLKSGQILHTA